MTVDKEKEIKIKQIKFGKSLSGDAKEFQLKDVDEEKDTSILGVSFGEEAETEKDVTKTVLNLMKKMMFHCMRLRFLQLPFLFKKERMLLYLSQESTKGNQRISNLV